jgi:hypothetical protein
MSKTDAHDNCFEFAAAMLPEGWQITVNIESGYAGLEVIDDSGVEIVLDRFEKEPFPDYVTRAARTANRIVDRTTEGR